MKRATEEALKILQSHDSFGFLRGAMTNLELQGEEGLGIGVYFVATSAHQPYPLRLEIQERTAGTAKYVIDKVSKILLPGSVVKLDPASKEDWDRFGVTQHSNVVVSQWRTEETDGSFIQLDVRPDGVVRAVGRRDDDADRVLVDSERVNGNFALLSSERYPVWPRPSRWLTMRQKEKAVSKTKPPLPLKDKDFAVWREVQRLLKERASIQVSLPAWEQAVLEDMSRDHNKAVHIPTLIQCWRTMCLLRSFQSHPQDNVKVLNADFLDLAAAVSLSKRLFREGKWFVSPTSIFTMISPVGERTGLLHPVTGRGVRYEHKREQLVDRQSLWLAPED